MKKEPKIRWTAREHVDQIGHEVNIEIIIHNIAELGFKHALRTVGAEYSTIFIIPLERYLAMSKEDKRREIERFVQEEMLATLTEAEKAGERVEEVAKMLSKEVVEGKIALPHLQRQKPLKIIDKELMQKITTQAKKLVYESPEMQEVLTLKELINTAKNHDLGVNWLSTAGYLLIEEVALKQWLIHHDHTEQELKMHACEGQ